MSGQGRYHHVGHRSLLVGDGAFEDLPKRGPDLDADIGQRWGFMRRHGYHVSILALPHAHRRVTSPPSSPLKPKRQPVWTGEIRLRTSLDSVASIDRTIVGPSPMARGVASCPPDFRGGRTQAITAANTEAALYNLAGHRTGNTSVCPASVCNFYRIDGSSSFKGTRFRMPASQPSSVFNSPLVQPPAGPEGNAKELQFASRRPNKGLS